MKALDTSEATAFCTRRRLVDGGFEGVLARKHPPNSTRPRILDGAERSVRHICQRYQPVGTRERDTQSLSILSFTRCSVADMCV